MDKQSVLGSRLITGHGRFHKGHQSEGGAIVIKPREGKLPRNCESCWGQEPSNQVCHRERGRDPSFGKKEAKN